VVEGTGLKSGEGVEERTDTEKLHARKRAIHAVLRSKLLPRVLRNFNNYGTKYRRANSREGP
jgi:hypothetical protein